MPSAVATRDERLEMAREGVPLVVIHRQLGHSNLATRNEWLSGVTERWGAAPVNQEWIVPMVGESVEGRVVAAGAPTAG
jgi:hypothetical protein